MRTPLTWKTEQNERSHTRRSLRIFGVTLEHSFYETDHNLPYRRLQRPTSGAQIGIAESFWVSTRRRAYGFGRVKDWATLQYLDLIVKTNRGGIATEAIGGGILSHDGYIQLTPCFTVTEENSPTMEIQNRNKIQADGRLRLHGAQVKDGLRMIGQFQFPFTIDPGRRQTLFLDKIDAPPSIDTENDTSAFWKPLQYEIQSLSFVTNPTGKFRWSRIHGRPEWDTRENS